MATSRRRKSTQGFEGVLPEVMEENAQNLEEIFVPSEEVTELIAEISPPEEEPSPVIETTIAPPAKVKKQLNLRKPVRNPRNVPRFSASRKTT